MGLTGKSIFFTDETKIDNAPLSGDKTRLTRKISEGDPKATEFATKMKKKFEKSIMIAGEYLSID